MKLVLSFFLFTTIFTNAYAGDCFRLNSPSDLEISFESYTTPRKNPVVIGFSQFELTGAAQAKSPHSVMNGLNVVIKTDESSLITDNPARQTIVANYFFQKMTGGGDIKAHFSSVDEDLAYLQVELNQQKREVPMHTSFQDGVFKAYGHIDVFDFKLDKPFQALDNICQELHDGKTWNVVKIMVQASIKGC